MKALTALSIILAALLAGCSDDADQVCSGGIPGVEAILFMQNDPLCLDSHADIQFTVSGGGREYILLEALFDRGPPYNTPFSEKMRFPCTGSLTIEFMCYSDEYWEHFTGTVEIPVTCHEFNYISVYADTVDPMSIFRDYDGYTAVEVPEPYRCEEVDSLYFAWGSVAE